MNFKSVQPSLQKTKDKLKNIVALTVIQRVKEDGILLKLGLGNEDGSLTEQTEELKIFVQKYINALFTV